MSLQHLAAEVTQLRKLQAEKRALESNINDLKALIYTAMEDATIGDLEDGSRVKWTPVTTRRVDTKALEADHPELVKQYLKESTHRQLRLGESK